MVNAALTARRVQNENAGERAAIAHWGTLDPKRAKALAVSQ
jgi:hypothetical protein